MHVSVDESAVCVAVLSGIDIFPNARHDVVYLGISHYWENVEQIK